MTLIIKQVISMWIVFGPLVLAMGIYLFTLRDEAPPTERETWKNQ